MITHKVNISLFGEGADDLLELEVVSTDEKGVNCTSDLVLNGRSGLKEKIDTLKEENIQVIELPRP